MDSEITGIMVYYYFVCKRKLWYFCHGIQMEAENENVQLGKLLDDSSYSRDSKHVLIDNMINSLISFVNSLVYTRILSEIYHTQLNPTISYLHEPGARRFSLCLDLSEIFKPLIVDRLIFSLLNKNQITEDSFTEELNFLHLKKSASQLIASEFENRMKQTIMHKELGRQVSYQYLMRLECYKLVKHLLGEKEYEGFRIWW